MCSRVCVCVCGRTRNQTATTTVVGFSRIVRLSQRIRCDEADRKEETSSEGAEWHFRARMSKEEE